MSPGETDQKRGKDSHLYSSIGLILSIKIFRPYFHKLLSSSSYSRGVNWEGEGKFLPPRGNISVWLLTFCHCSREER